MEYRITRGREEHIPLLGDIERAAAAIFPPGSVPDFIFDDVTPARYFEEALPRGNFWVALWQEEPVGYALLRFVPAEAAELSAAPDTASRIASCESKRPGIVGDNSNLEGEATIALLAQIDVLPEHGRRGLGRSLVAEAAGKARLDGYEWLYLTTFRDIPWNAPFYSRLAFVALGADEAPAQITEILREEREAGLLGRVAMRLKL